MKSVIEQIGNLEHDARGGNILLYGKFTRRIKRK